ncbi:MULTISPECIES: AEC family transporter [unclassified Streptomyces]|uniref:AEC family transporter n=1 Tax=unclassified Streptomyces TaxID=2593676 RepID=UPI0022533C50|nr:MULTISPECIES: AEC family transporter [unclassified Streptomyces]MCX4625987.1 AEC family transporter [Streptomyces sp. NBC_01443]
MGTAAALEKLVPVLLAFGGGVLLARRKTVPAEASKAFADYAFLFAVPCYLFGNIYASDLGALFNWRAIGAYAAAAALAVLAIAFASGAHGVREPRDVALRVMAGVQVNTAYFAVPVFITLFGTAAPIFPVLLFQVCVLSLVVISIMELGRAGPASGGPGQRLVRAVGASLSTPLVLACNAGIVLNLLSVHVPKVVLDGAAFVGDSASPIALFALGLHLGGLGLDIRGTGREELALIAFKCLGFPLLAWAVCGLLFGVRGEWLTYLVLIAAMPTPQNLFVFAQRYDVGVDLSASLVIKSSVVSLLLLPVWLQTVAS